MPLVLETWWLQGFTCPCEGWRRSLDGYAGEAGVEDYSLGKGTSTSPTTDGIDTSE